MTFRHCDLPCRNFIAILVSDAAHCLVSTCGHMSGWDAVAPDCPPSPSGGEGSGGWGEVSDHSFSGDEAPSVTVRSAGGPRRRGRPPGLYGSHPYRASLKAERELEKQRVQDDKTLRDTARAAHARRSRAVACNVLAIPSAPERLLKSLDMVLACGPVNRDASDLSLGEVFSQSLCSRDRPADVNRKRLMNLAWDYAGPVARHAAPAGASAAFHGHTRFREPSRICQLAALVHLGVRFCVSTLCGYLLPLLQNMMLCGIALITALQFDETPTVLKPGGTNAGARILKKKTPAAVCKVLQSEYQAGFVVQGDLTHGSPLFLSMELPCPLQVMDSTTGETLRHALKSSTDVKMWDALREHFSICVDIATCDRAGPNMRSEKCLAAERPSHARVTMPCDIHGLSTAQGRSVGTMASDISGVIAVGLTCRVHGALDKLRQCLADELKEMFVIYDGAFPPPDSDEEVVFKRRVLKSLLGSTAVDKQRYEILDRCLTGGIRGPRLEHHGSIELLDLVDMVVTALLPKCITVFPRHRWLTSINSVTDLSLLCSVNKVFDKAAPKWIASLTQQGSSRSKAPSTAPDADAFVGVPLQDSVRANSQLGGASGWQEANERNKVTVVSFAGTSPGPRLLVMRVAMQPQV